MFATMAGGTSKGGQTHAVEVKFSEVFISL